MLPQVRGAPADGVTIRSVFYRLRIGMCRCQFATAPPRSVMNSHRLIILDALSSEKCPFPPSPASGQRGSYWGPRCRPQQLSTTAEDHLEETLDYALSCNGESYLAPVSTLVPFG